MIGNPALNLLLVRAQTYRINKAFCENTLNGELPKKGL